jgi:hypothetical protein
MANGKSAADEITQLADDAFRRQEFQQSFAIVRAGIHSHGGTHEALVKRYLLYLEAIAKSKSKDTKKDHPPRVLYVRDLLAALPADLVGRLSSLTGEEAVTPGDKCVLIKERRVMVVGLLLAEWRLLLEKHGSDRMQLISGVEEAVMRGLSQVRCHARAALTLTLTRTDALPSHALATPEGLRSDLTPHPDPDPHSAGGHSRDCCGAPHPIFPELLTRTRRWRRHRRWRRS